MSLITDCAVLPAHVQQACNDYRKGGISALGIIDTDASIADFTNATNWNDAITAGKVKIIKGIKGIFPKASAVEGENAIACGSEKMLDGFDGSFTWKDFNVSADNDNFYAKLNQKRCYLAIYYCAEQEIRIFDPTGLVNFVVPYATSPEGQREKQLYDCTAMWFGGLGWYPSLYAAPAGIFTD